MPDTNYSFSTMAKIAAAGAGNANNGAQLDGPLLTTSISVLTSNNSAGNGIADAEVVSVIVVR